MQGHMGVRGIWRLLVLPLSDLLSFYVALATTIALRQPSLLNAGTAAAFLPLFAVWMAALYTLEFYDLRVVRDSVALVRNLMVLAAVCFFTGTTYFYALEPYAGLTPKTHLVLVILISHLLILTSRRALLWMLQYSLFDQKLVFLCDREHVAEIEKDFSGHFKDKNLHMVAWQPGVDMIVADSRWVDEHWDEARDVFMGAVMHKVPVLSLESFYELFFGKVSPDYAANPSWTLKFALPQANSLYWKVKRACDVAGSALLLILLSPVLAATAALVAVLDGRPVFFGQERAGLLGRPFMLWKFRTMTVGADAQGPFTSAATSVALVTKLGAYLRRFRLDELPQLWNVLRGDMSLVGPRPEWMREVEVLEKTVPGYHLRHMVYPGITGWAQLNFRATSNVGDSLEKIHYDLYYLKYLSFSLDLGILLKTLKRVCVNDLTISATPRPAVKTARVSPDWGGDLRALARTRKSSRPHNSRRA